MTRTPIESVQVRNAAGGGEALHEPLATTLSGCSRADASDVHIDPIPGGFELRIRVDGVSRAHERVDEREGLRLINQIKVAAQVELEHLHRPAEGQFEFHDDTGRRHDVRATIVPTFSQKEAVHLRLLTLPNGWRDIGQLGLKPHEQEMVERGLVDSQGLVLIAGVTGAGKTTTQYALARSQDLENRVAVSIEDPVEYELPHMRQMEVHEGHGFSMSEGLRVMLRMDPDVMLIGEVRDRESAVTAAHAASAGRLVLATVHARDAAAAIDAMHYRAVPYYVLGAAMRMVIVQNLVRRLCPRCTVERPTDAFERRVFEQFEVTPPAMLRDAVGCDDCRGQGYVGRRGVFEVVPIDETMAEFLAGGPHQHQIRKRIRENGTQSLLVSAMHRVADHSTSFAELVRLHSRELSPLHPRLVQSDNGG